MVRGTSTSATKALLLFPQFFVSSFLFLFLLVVFVFFLFSRFILTSIFPPWTMFLFYFILFFFKQKGKKLRTSLYPVPIYCTLAIFLVFLESFWLNSIGRLRLSYTEPTSAYFHKKVSFFCMRLFSLFYSSTPVMLTIQTNALSPILKLQI